MAADSFGDLVAATGSDLGGADGAEPDAAAGLDVGEVGHACLDLDHHSAAEDVLAAALAPVDGGDLAQKCPQLVPNGPTSLTCGFFSW